MVFSKFQIFQKKCRLPADTSHVIATRSTATETLVDYFGREYPKAKSGYLSRSIQEPLWLEPIGGRHPSRRMPSVVMV